MKLTRKLVVPGIVIVALGLGAVALFAQPPGQTPAQHDKDIVKFMADHKMTLAKAIEAAEQHSKGQALRAMAEMENADVVVKVACLVGDNVKHLVVDAKTGKVTEAAPPQAMGPSPGQGKHEHPKK